MTIKIKQMTKGKGYITSKQTKSYKPVTFGDPFSVDAIGPWESRASLDEWNHGNWEYPKPTKGNS